MKKQIFTTIMVAITSLAFGQTHICQNGSQSLPQTGTYSSSNTSVATVDGSGNVYGVSFGTATISYTASATLTVTIDPAPSPIRGVFQEPTINNISVSGTTYPTFKRLASNCQSSGFFTSFDTTVASIQFISCGNANVNAVDTTGRQTHVIYTANNGCSTKPIIIQSNH